MIKVVVSGALGRMGTQVIAAVDGAADMQLVAGFDPFAKEGTTVGQGGVPVYTVLADALAAGQPDVLVDFSRPDAAEANLRAALAAGVNCVLGTTGLSEEKLQQIYDESAAGDAALFCAPNFTTGAGLMMLFAQQAAKDFPDAEVIEFHHDGKKDSPSGTAVRTAKLIAGARDFGMTAPGRETELEGMEGARGALVCDVPVHSVRTAGYVAHQEVIFGSAGQTLTIRHDSIDRSSYMPGVLLAVRAVGGLEGLVVGLEKLMD